MICDMGDFTVRLEESVYEENLTATETFTAETSTPQRRTSAPIPQTPSSVLSQAVTGGSKANYRCYSICLSKGESTAELDVVAVLIETKMEGRSSNAVAQAIGYFLAFKTLPAIPPLLFVLTEEFLKIILFPFKSAGNEDMITAIMLEPLPIWEDSYAGVVSKTLKLAAMLSLHRPVNAVKYPGMDVDGQLKRKLSEAVISEKDKRVVDMQERAEKEKKKAEEEKKKAKEERKMGTW